MKRNKKEMLPGDFFEKFGGIRGVEFYSEVQGTGYGSFQFPGHLLCRVQPVLKKARVTSQSR